MHECFKYHDNNLATINIKLKPSAKQELIEGCAIINDKCYLKIKVQAPKVDGKANRALIELLSKVFKVKYSCIDIIHGLTSEYKIIAVKNIDESYLKMVLENYIQSKQLTML